MSDPLHRSPTPAVPPTNVPPGPPPATQEASAVASLWERGLAAVRKGWMGRPAWLRTRKAWLLGLPVVALIVVLSALFGRSGRSSADVPVKQGAIIEAVYGIGTVTANRTYQLKIGSTSTVRGIFVREGDFVPSGATVVSMHEGDVVRSYAAPFSGTVTALPFKESEVVPPAFTIFTLTDLRDRYLLVSLEQQGAVRVRPGQPVKVSFESMREQTYQGIVRTVYSNDNQFLVRVDAADLPPQILPGMTADVGIEIARKPDALLVPVAAISSGRLTLVRNGRVLAVEVKVGLVDGAWAEVTSGDVAPGDLVRLPKPG